MKPFTKRLALVMGLGLLALCCWMAPVYITTTQNWWDSSNGFVRLIVSNQTLRAIMTVDTNTLRVGFNSNNIARSFVVVGQKPNTNSTGNGLSAATTGILLFQAGAGGDSATNSLSASGGAAGGVTVIGGVGGSSLNTSSNSTGGTGGAMALSGGVGGGERATATNSVTGGGGGSASVAGGSGGIPVSTATNVVGGSGGVAIVAGGSGAQPIFGWINKPGDGGAASVIGGNAGNTATRTNGAAGGNANLTAGNGGSVGSATGNGGAPGVVNITGGNGADGVGGTNSDGGHTFTIGGTPGTGAVPGNVVVGRTSAGAARGGLQVGLFVAGTTATLTNLLSVTATLDFASIAAGTIADLPVAFAGAADGDVVTVAVPLSSVTNCTWMGYASNAVVYVRAANGQPVTAQDPNSGVFRIVLQKFR